MLLLLLPCILFSASFVSFSSASPVATNSSRCIVPRHSKWTPVPCPSVVPSSSTPSSNAPATLYVACNAPAQFCEKARSALSFAVSEILQVVRFTKPLRVNVTIAPYCSTSTSTACSSSSTVHVVGTASPTILVPLRDTKDGRTRFYPQFLARQLPLQSHPQYAATDITATFYSDAATWFPGDPAITLNQTDFRWVALHELLHGLGFGITAWRDWGVSSQQQARWLYPYPASDMTVNIQQGFTFNGEFYETIYDSGLVCASNRTPWSYLVTNYMNGFTGRRAVRFNSISQFEQALANSDAGDIAQILHGLTVTNNSVVFSANNGPITLATGEQVFSEDPAAILGHVDQNTYIKSENFLMCPAVVTGITLEQQFSNVLKYNNLQQDAGIQAGYIGPGIRNILGAMGYDIIPPTTRPASTSANQIQFVNVGRAL